MGLALAIDYTLLIISRYRDELADGVAADEALIRTMATAGRTVLFSAMTVALSMVAMVLFPMYFLKSFAYAGIAMVAFAAVAAIVVTPAAIVLLGDRLDSLDVRRLLRRLLGRPEPVAKPVEEIVLVPLHEVRDAPGDSDRAGVVALLLAARRPVPGRRSGVSPTTGCCPDVASAHQVGDQLRNDFADRLVDATSPSSYPTRPALTPDELEPLRRRPVRRFPTCRRCPRPAGTFVDGARVGPPSAATGIDGRQCIPDGRQQRAAVLRCLRGAARPAARGAPRPAASDGAARPGSRRSTATASQAITDRGCRWCSA